MSMFSNLETKGYILKIIYLMEYIGEGGCVGEDCFFK